MLPVAGSSARNTPALYVLLVVYQFLTYLLLSKLYLFNRKEKSSRYSLVVLMSYENRLRMMVIENN